MWQEDLIAIATFVNACLRKRIKHLISLVWLEEM